MDEVAGPFGAGAPIAAEYGRLRADQVLFTYLHLAADKGCTDALLAAGTT